LAALFTGAGNWQEVTALAAAGRDLVGDAFVVEAEMAFRLAEWCVQDRIGDDGRRYGRSLSGFSPRYLRHLRPWAVHSKGAMPKHRALSYWCLR